MAMRLSQLQERLGRRHNVIDSKSELLLQGLAKFS